MGYIKSVGTVIIYIGFFLAVITFLPGLPPEAEYSEYSIKFPSDVQLKYETKTRLQEPEILFSGEIKGPEDIASFNGEIYTGIRGGYVVKIEENRIKPIVKFGQKCDGLWQEEKCGRPLGLKFNDNGELFVADAYYGIFKVNVNTRQYVNIVNSSEPIDGKTAKIFNTLDIAKNGDIYWTDSSTDFYLHDGMYSFFANPSGRLIRYNAATKKNEVLIKNLGFPNGVLLSDDESFVIVGSTLNLKILKYNLKGPKAGQQEIFIEGLPGLCDNIHSDGQGGFLVSLLAPVDSEHPLLPLSFIPHPYIRKMISRLIYSIEVGKYLTLKTDSLILRMDKTGKILNILYSENGDVSDISSAHINDGYLWLGSPWNDNIMRIPLKQAFPDLIINTKSSAGKEQKQKEPLLTVSATPNVKVEAKPMKSTIKQDTTKPSSKSTIKGQTKQEVNSDTITPKPTSQSTTTSTTTTSKPTSSLPKASTKEVKKDNLKKTEKDNPTEINKDKFKSQVKSETSKQINDARSKTKSDDSVKKDTQSIKSKPVKENEDKTKK
ncbi:hypothetical protein QLX08_000896 [Tetragonisca angustula]|uniref:Strictosidine synthase conserved region domain-containing protein n=1 Tax=Tetragonisca angustula TaxID=166442 RepID=A0AAW1AI23_9HYME